MIPASELAYSMEQRARPADAFPAYLLRHVSADHRRRAARGRVQVIAVHESALSRSALFRCRARRCVPPAGSLSRAISC